MTQRDEFNSGKAFQGDRAFSLRTIPVNARISRASATITPIDAGKGVAPFTETIAFSGNNGDFGATKSVAANWTEVEFHGRRTLVSVEGTGLDNCTLQVDLGGGAYAEINPAGAFRTPSDTDVFHLKGNPAPLPGLTVAKFKLTAPPSGAAPAVTKVTIRSVPSSVSIRLGALAPVFTHPGEMTGPLTTPDFAPILQALLADTKVDNGFYDIPVILHSDNIGRLELVFEIDSASRQSALPAGLKEIVLEYGYDTVPRPGSGALSIAVPVASQSAPEAITARVRGAFDETRIVFGPTGEANPDGFAGITGSVSVAQPFSPLAATGATAIDLLLDVVDRTAHMRLDFRADLDGRPDDTTLLPSPVEFDLDRDALAGKSQWTSVALPSEFQFQAKRYWIVLQSIAGAANWRTQPADPTHPALQTTTDGGLSWRTTPLSGFFRVRRRPERFQIPIELQIGAGAEAARVKLDRFAPLGRVDFDAGPELSQGLNQHLANVAKTANPVPEGEHLKNADFKSWHVVGNSLGSVPGSIPLPGIAQAIAVAPDGRQAYVACTGASQLFQECFLAVIDVLTDRTIGSISLGAGRPTLIAIHPDGDRAYVAIDDRIHVVDLAKGKLEGAANVGPIESLAVDSDGSQLFLTDLNGQNMELRALPIASLNGAPAVLDVIFSRSRGANRSVVATGAAADRLFLSDGTGAFLIIHPSDAPTIVPLVRSSGAFAVSREGSLAVVADAQGNTINTVDLERGSATGPPIPIGAPVTAVAISPDGSRAYLLSGPKIVEVDLNRRTVLQAVNVPVPASSVNSSVTITPQGDRLYVQDQEAVLHFLPIGTRAPVEWQAFGSVSPDAVAQVTAISLGGAEVSVATALSQVVPVAASTAYDFGFLARTSEAGVTAEVRWIGAGCVLLRDDLMAVPASRSLAPQVARLNAPPSATKAEVRFVTPSGPVTIAAPSLSGTIDGVVNGTLQALEGDLPANWTLTPPSASGLVRNGNGFKLRNSGNSGDIDLNQAMPSSPGQAFSLQFNGSAIALLAGAANPRVEVRWISAAGVAVAPTVVVPVVPGGPNRLAANGGVPDGAARAEVHLLAPTGATLQIDAVSLKFQKLTQVPLPFISQAPGELAVTDLHVGFDAMPVAPPPVPAGGLCQPTPPESDSPANDCYCCCCCAPRAMKNALAVTTPAGRPATAGACATCGAPMVSLGGPVVSGAKPVVLRILPSGPGAFVPPADPVLTRTRFDRIALPPMAPLTAIVGIGEARAQRFTEIGLGTIDKLARADPQKIAEIVIGVSLEMATGFVQQARKLFEASLQPVKAPDESGPAQPKLKSGPLD